MKEDKVLYRLPRITIGGVSGGSGKSIVTLGVTRSFVQDGVDVSTFKKGPDYIDAGWMALASGKPCHNLDSYMMQKETILRSFGFRASKELSIIEGNRGLYDGFDYKGSCSTAELARLLDSPVLLVVDCTKATRSVAAVILGFRQFEPDLKLAGVVLNRVGSSRHESLMRRAIERYTDIPVIGAVARFKHDPLPMRHLGVTPMDEHPESLNVLDKLAEHMRQCIDMNTLRRIAEAGSEWRHTVSDPLDAIDDLIDTDAPAPLIGIVRDAAFQFYYPENIDALERAGARIVFVNAETDVCLPDVDGLYIGGGFPETRAANLSANKGFLASLRNRVESGLPVYAECGGLMYLGNSIVWDGKRYPMAGVLKWNFVTGKRPVGHGYTTMTCVEDSPFYSKNTEIRGHEFHYSRPEPSLRDVGCSEKMVCRVVRGKGFVKGMEGVCYKSVFGTYTHIHVLDNYEWAVNFVKSARAYFFTKQ